MQISPGRAVNAARKCIGWTEADLAKEADLPYRTVIRVERDMTSAPKLFLKCLRAMELDMARLGPSAEGEDKAYYEECMKKYPPGLVEYLHHFAVRNPEFILAGLADLTRASLTQESSSGYQAPPKEAPESAPAPEPGQKAPEAAPEASAPAAPAAASEGSGAAASEGPAPAASDVASGAADSKPAAPAEEAVPAAPAKEAAPAAETKETVPAAPAQKEAPADQTKEAAPAAPAEEAAPAVQTKETAPAAPEQKDAPANQPKEAAPAEEVAPAPAPGAKKARKTSARKAPAHAHAKPAAPEAVEAPVASPKPEPPAPEAVQAPVPPAEKEESPAPKPQEPEAAEPLVQEAPPIAPEPVKAPARIRRRSVKTVEGTMPVSRPKRSARKTAEPEPPAPKESSKEPPAPAPKPAPEVAPRAAVQEPAPSAASGKDSLKKSRPLVWDAIDLGGFPRCDAPLTKEYRPNQEISFAIPIRGDAMAPLFVEGSLLFVVKGEVVPPGEFGIFEVAELGLVCRRRINDQLVGGTPAVPVISFDRVIRTCGKVVGYCPPDQYLHCVH